MKIYSELESLGLFEWLSKTHNLKDTDIAPEYLDELPLNDIHRTVANAMTFRWFRENYYLFSSFVEYYKQASDEAVRFEGEYMYHITGGYNEDGFTTYEEAENACIDKLISICKQQDK